MADEQVSSGPVDDGVSELTLTDASALYMAQLDAPEDDKDNEQPAERAEPATAANESDSQEDDATPPETEATGEDDEDEAPADDEPQRPLPRSWTKEHAERWAKLDPDLQDYLLEQDKKASAEVRRSQNEAAEKLKGLTAKEQQAEQARTTYENQVKAAVSILEREQQANFPDIKTIDDVKKLAAEDPLRYLQWQAHQNELAWAMAEKQRADKTAADKATEKRSSYRNEQRTKLNELVPDFADDAKYKAAWERAIPELDAIGASRADLDRLAETEGGSEILLSAWFQKLIADSQRLADINKAKVAVLKKPVQPVTRPSARPAGNPGREANAQALSNRLSQTGSLDDAFALYEAQLSGARRRA